RHCLLHEIMRDVAFEAFQAGGIGLVLDQFGLTEQNERMTRIMSTVPNQQENYLAEDIFSVIAENIGKRSYREKPVAVQQVIKQDRPSENRLRTSKGRA